MEAFKWNHRPVDARIFIDRLSNLQWDVEVLNTIPLKDRVDEVPLFQQKWWDYRDMHPGKATALFAHHYGEAYAVAMVRRTGTQSPSVFNSPQWNPFEEAAVRAKAFWKARRICDEAGMPYWFYLSVLFGSAEEYFENLPRPQELWRRDLIGVVLESWEHIENSGHIMFPSDDIYQLRYNWSNKPCQHEWEAFYSKRLKQVPQEVRELMLEINGEFIRESVAAEALAA